MNNKMSRRDWFRLKPTSPNPSVVTDKGTRLGHDPATTSRSKATKDSPSQSGVLKDIAHPPNHDGMDLTQLPPMREAELARAQVEELFADVADFATQVQLMQRSSPSGSRASGLNVSTRDQLQWAKSALFSGDISRLQIRYRWENALWIDTLSMKDGSIHLVRIRHQEQV